MATGTAVKSKERAELFALLSDHSVRVLLDVLYIVMLMLNYISFRRLKLKLPEGQGLYSPNFVSYTKIDSPCRAHWKVCGRSTTGSVRADAFKAEGATNLASQRKSGVHMSLLCGHCNEGVTWDLLMIQRGRRFWHRVMFSDESKFTIDRPVSLTTQCRDSRLPW